jgi:protoporphyrinogen oxidase
VATPPQRRAHIAIAGAGFTGLVCALHLLNAGYQVTLLEASENIGGLTATADFKSFRWDRFYHCILTSDRALMTLLEQIQLKDQLHWTATEVGFFSHGELHTMTKPADLIRFPHLSLWDKLRLAAGTLYAARLCSGTGLENIPLETWTKRVFGERVFREMWEPLFRCKLGETRRDASAAFLWGTLRRLYSTREKGASKQEKLGYVRGGYATVFERLAAMVKEGGAQIRTGVGVERVSASDFPNDGARSMVKVMHSAGTEMYDGVILTLPNHLVASCLELTDPNYRQMLGRVQYLGLVCVVLVLRRQLSPYYVTNITEQSPFTGIIEMTNLIDKDIETAGLHLVYLPSYTTPDDPLFQASDAETWKIFEPGLLRIHPDLIPDDIVDRFVFRERVVQPVPTLGYSQLVPAPRTPVRGVYLVNTAQIENNTLNNNVMATLAETTCNALIADIPAVAQLKSRTELKEPIFTPMYEHIEGGV